MRYKNQRLRQAYKALEDESAAALRGYRPAQLRGEVAGYVTGSRLTEEEAKLLKAADRLSALIKCTEEVQAGNREFAAALTQQRAALKEMHCPEADYFIVHMLPCYAQPLDELTSQSAD